VCLQVSEQLRDDECELCKSQRELVSFSGESEEFAESESEETSGKEVREMNPAYDRHYMERLKEEIGEKVNCGELDEDILVTLESAQMPEEIEQLLEAYS